MDPTLLDWTDAVLLAVGAGTCLSLSSAYAADPAKPYLGMSKDEIIACAGEPHGKYKRSADGETLTYHYSAQAPCPAGPAKEEGREEERRAERLCGQRQEEGRQGLDLHGEPRI